MYKKHFEELIYGEHEKVGWMNREQLVNQEVQRISSEEVRTAMRRWKSGKAVGADDIPLEVWRCFGERAVDILTRLLNTILESEH